MPKKERQRTNMIEWKGKTWRNLEEQVLYLTERLEDAIRSQLVLAQMGIKVVGDVPTAEDLPNPADYEGEYGDAYITKDDNHYHIFTRPFDGDEYPHWFDIGVFPAPGPEGPEGPQGEQGETGQRGSIWQTGSESYPPVPADGQPGDLYLHTSGAYIGAVEQLTKAGSLLFWAVKGTIRGPKGDKGDQGNQGEMGPQGPQGPEGQQGRPGESFDILDVLSSVDDLPVATEEYLNDAYLIPDTNGALHLWFIRAGVTPLSWYDGGPFTNAGTLVFVGGNATNTWNADSKLDKPDVTDKVIIIDERGNVAGRPFGQYATTGYFSLVYRNANGFSRVKTPNDSDGAQYDDDIITNKGYVKSLKVYAHATSADVKAPNDDHVFLPMIFTPSEAPTSASLYFVELYHWFGSFPTPCVVYKNSAGENEVGYVRFTSSGFYYKTPSMSSEEEVTSSNYQSINFNSFYAYQNPTHT